MLKLGSQGISGLYLGDMKIKKAYLGEDLVFEERVSLSDTLGTKWISGEIGVTPTYASVYNNLESGNGCFVASVSPSQASQFILRSGNGVNWTQVALPGAGNGAGYVSFANGKFYYARPSASVVYVSSTGAASTWSPVTLPTISSGATFVFAGGDNKLLAIEMGASGGKCFRSTNGISWSAGTPTNASYLHRICYGDGMFLAMSSSNGASYISRDHGLSWASAGTGPKTLKNMLFANGKFYAVGTATSTPGIEVYDPSTNTWRDLSSIARNGDTATASGIAGDDNIILFLTQAYAHTSRDGGLTWQHTALPKSVGRTNPAYGSKKFVALQVTASKQSFIYSV